ncbi:MAG: energy-coupling factor transporter transmembrane component T [Desulfosalsimonadaceae bacterium]
MAELTVFGFRPGCSVMHRIDVRFKFLCLILVSVVSLHSSISGLLLLFAVFAAAVCYLRIPFGPLIKNLRYFFVLLIFVFAARALTTPGEMLWQGAALTVTLEGAARGAEICLRLFLLVLAGLCFIATSRSSDVRSAVARFLRPVPLIQEMRVATMLSLILRFIPLIFDQAAKTAEAQRARGVENRKNPVYRLRCFVLPFLRRVFADADRLAVAMEARCYNEQRSSRKFCAGPPDWIALALVAALCFAAVNL